MSVRAYKILEWAETDSFNFWHDEFFMDLFRNMIGFERLHEGGGEFEITREQLEKMKNLFEGGKDKWNKEQQERTLEIFKQIGEDFGDEGYAIYIAF